MSAKIENLPYPSIEGASPVYQAATMPVPQPQSESAAILGMIERVARDPSIDIDRMERLLAMRERMVERDARMAYNDALRTAQGELPVINRRGRIEVRAKDGKGERTGNVLQSTPYALWEDINEAIKPILARHGFALSFRTGMAEDGRLSVTAILAHNKGHQQETTMVLPYDSTGSKNTVQSIGSSTSYGKRYTAIALLNITSGGEDDDGGKGGDEPRLSKAQLQTITDLLTEVGGDEAKMCKHFKVEHVADIPAAHYQRVIDALNAKRSPL